MLLAPCYMAFHHYGIRSLLVVAVSVRSHTFGLPFFGRYLVQK